LQLPEQERKDLFRDLQRATYASFLVSYVQGLHIIEKADQEQKWQIDLAGILQLWRGGCIIQSDYIVDLFEKVYRQDGHDDNDLLDHHEIGGSLMENYPALKRVVLKAMEADAPVPSMSASLEYLKYAGSTKLPTQFMEAELDYFGAHMFDLKSAEPGKPVTGEQHFEWKPAKGLFGDQE
jgi:6-phosphogluconate dehydrogenase